MKKRKTDKSQSDRFKKTAREHDTDESDGALDRIFGKLDLRKKPQRQDEGDRSDGGNERDDKDG